MDATEVAIVHGTVDGKPLCGADTTSQKYQAVPLTAIHDPDDDQAVLTCGACLKAMSNGAEPMGGWLKP